MGDFEIRLEKVRFYAYHGVFDSERKAGNDFEVDLLVRYPAPDPDIILGDSLEDTVCYAGLYDIVKKEMAVASNLLETVAFRIVSGIKEKFPRVTHIECRITKTRPPIPDFNGVASVTFSL